MMVLGSLAAVIAGWAIGTLAIWAVLEITGFGVNKDAIPRSLGQAFWWSLFGAIAGTTSGRRKADGEEEKPAKPLPSWALVAMGCVLGAGVLAAVLLPKIGEQGSAKAAPYWENDPVSPPEPAPTEKNTLTYEEAYGQPAKLVPFNGKLDSEQKLVPFDGKLDGEN